MPIATKDQKTRISIKALHLDFIGPRELHFPAIITEFKDNFETKWKEEEVYGRMDPVTTYSGTGRKFNLGFRIISEDADIATTNLGYLSNLIQYLYPKYKETSNSLVSPTVIQSPPFFEIRFMNVIASSLTPDIGLRGYINSFSHTTPFGTKDSMQIFGENNNLLFSDIQVNIGFTVLHEKRIGWYSAKLADAGISGNYPYNIGSGEIGGNIVNTYSTEFDKSFEANQSVNPPDFNLMSIKQANDIQLFGGKEQ